MDDIDDDPVAAVPEEKVLYVIDLGSSRPAARATTGALVRPLVDTDRDALARLMLDAYVGTIDHHGGTLSDAFDEVDVWLAGSPMLGHSCGAVVGEQLVSAALVSEYDDVPFIAYVMTHPDHKGNGWAGTVVDRTLTTLRSSEYEQVLLYITRGNTPSERLFAGAGARAV